MKEINYEGYLYDTFEERAAQSKMQMCWNLPTG